MSNDSFDNVFIIIPCYNEAPVIAEVIVELSEHFKNILVVNDGSTDSTADELRNTDVIYIEHPFNLGQGAAIFTGFEYLKRKNTASACITFDADGQHSIDDAIIYAKEILNCKEEIIFGSRFLAQEMEIPAVKRFVLKVVIRITNFLSGMSLTDSHIGLKAYKTSVLGKLSTDLYRSAFETELIFSVAKKNIAYKELPASVRYTKYSTEKGQSLLEGLIILEDLVRLIFKR